MAFRLHDDVVEISDDFTQLFLSTRKAIECGNVKKFISSLDSMRSVSGNCAVKERFLDVCIKQEVVSRHTRLRCFYFMSLLAYAGINNQKEMVDILIKRKACTWISSEVTGSPMTQMMIYCLHHGCPELIDEKIIKCLIDSIPEDKLTEETDGAQLSNFDNNVTYHIPADRSLNCELCCPLELAIQIQRIDIAKQLVQAGANSVSSDVSSVEQTLPLFMEFFEFGTNQYMSWLLHEHLSQNQVSGFIEGVLEKKDIIFSSYAKKAFKEEAGRHHVHAILTCGHEEMIKKFIDRFPDEDGGQKTLKAKDSAERTALQVAAGNGDLESVTTLINMYIQYINQEVTDQGDGADIARALMAAAKGNHAKVIEVILRMDEKLFPGNRSSVLHVRLNGVMTWKIAVQEGLSCIFEILRHYHEVIVAERIDDEGNTLGHITAKSGNVDLFKVVFPLQKKLPNDFVTENLQSKTHYSMFWALLLENESNDTPLMVAIDNNHPNILESLQERAVERELKQNAKQNKEKTEWEHFWRDHGEHLLVHACSCGSSRSLDCVRVLINITKSTLGLLPQRWTVDAFQACTKTGNDDVVNYFLQHFQTFISQELKDKSLLEVAELGHHRCVRILLKHGADIKAKDISDGNNCLMKAIEKNHREVVLAILSDETFGPESLRFVRKDTQSHVWKRVVKTQPLILLIKHMPEIAEWVLNKCALSKPPQSPVLFQDVVIAESSSSQHQVHIDDTDFGGTLERLNSLEDEKVQKGRDYIMENKFELLEPPQDELVETPQGNNDTTDNEDAGGRIFKTINSFSHPIQTMVDYDRAEMLNHNLVQTWIDHKLRDVLPDLIIYIILYLMFLAILTTFALLLPRPGPWTQYCEKMMMNTTSVNETFPDGRIADNGTCEGQSRHLVNAFYFSAVVLILSSLAYLVLEVAQFCHRLHRYLLEIENYVQVLMYISVIIFAFPFGQTSCWCLPAWKWQIGALALFLAWLNLLLLIRYIPWLNVGQHSTMLFNVYFNFLKLIYLPILILVTFAIPLYMLLVDSTPTEEREATSPLAVFATPFTTLYNTIFQTAGEIDGNGVIKSSLHYEAASYVLFLVFVIAVPILFNNFLTGMAVGETNVEENKAYLSLTKRKIYYIFEVQNVLYRRVIPYITSKFRKSMSIRELKLKADDEDVLEFRAKDKAIKDDIKSKTRAKSTKKRVKRLALLMTQNQTTLNSHKVELEQSLRTLGAEVSDIKNEMAGIKDTVAGMKDTVAGMEESMAVVKEMIYKLYTDNHKEQ